MASTMDKLTTQQHTFLQPTQALNASILDLGKLYLNPLAQNISATQSERQKRERENKKRKRNEHEQPQELLRMQRLYTDGFDVEQIWQQAKRVLDASLTEVRKDAAKHTTHASESDSEADKTSRKRKAVRFEEDYERDEDSAEDSLGEEGVDYVVEDEDGGSGEEDDQDERKLAEEPEDMSNEGSLDLGDDTPPSDMSEDEQPQEELVQDKHGLNDGFFSIDQFNKNTQFLENVDARGDDNDGAASDEEDVDWEADPLAQGATVGLRQPQNPAVLAEPDDDDDEDDGPTFGDVDLNAPDTDEDEEEDAIAEDGVMDDFSNTNDVMYKDFFAPPAGSKARRLSKTRPERHGNRPQPGHRSSGPRLATEDDALAEDDEVEMDRAMSSVHRDLIDDEDEDLDEEADETNDPKEQNLSTHERRMAEFRKEIAQLERENVSSKPWALTGETVASARPENALLEEDLEFERAGKPLPVITQEVNESIEQLIKRRILNNEFDEVPRRRPELENINGPTRRGVLDAHGRREELSDVKPQRGLGEEYEDEYLRKSDPNYVDQRSEVTKKKHAEIEKQWIELRGQLDALCNWHYKPRPPDKNFEVRTNAPVVQMEDVRPAAEAGADATGLAPQEVYKPGQEGKANGEIVTKGGTAVSREEETRENKRRRRRRNKEKAHKARGNPDAHPGLDKPAADANRKKAQKQGERAEVVNTLKQGGVKIIGKKGELQDVEGKAASTNAHGGKVGVAGYML